MKRFILPVSFSSLVVGTAPFIGQVIPWFKELVSDRFVIVMGGLFSVALVLLLLAAVLQIRRNRWLRYASLAGGLALMALQLFVLNRGDPETDVVERIHFLEYGLIAFLFYRSFRAKGDPSVLATTFLAVTLVGVLDEWVQWFVPVRTGEVLDVMLNSYAGLCGLIVALAVQPLEGFSWRLKESSISSMCRLLAATLLTFGLFFHSAHLGYGIEDGEIGFFRSYFPQEKLADLQRLRSQQWKERPLEALTPLEKEDYYRTEAGWHTSHRNASYSRGDYYSAWKENLILEKYFEPFLELRQRFPPEQRALVDERRPKPDPYPYASPADTAPTPFGVMPRIVTRPTKAQFWTLISIGVMASAAFPRLARSRAKRSPLGSPSPADRSPR